MSALAATMRAMSSFLQRVATRFGFVPAAQAAAAAQHAADLAASQATARTLHQAAAHQRNLLAALSTHDTASWGTDAGHINLDTESGLTVARARSRDAARNNPWAKRFVGMVLNNVLGPHGAQYQSRVRSGTGNLKAGPNDKLEAGYAAFSARGAFDITGRYSRRTFDRLVLRHVVVDGECFVRFVPGRGPHRLQVQLIVADAVPITARADLANGVRVRQGIEFDRDGAVLAFHVRTDDTTVDAVAATRGLKRVPASEMHHIMLPQEAGQLRGVPWMHTALKPMYQAGDFASAGLNKARESAKRGGFFTQDPNAQPQEPGGMADGKDAAGQAFQTLADGQWEALPPGYEAKPFESDYPNIEYGQFIKDAVRNVAAALETSYITLGNDLEAVNYSSGQLGLEDERTMWLGVQEWFTDEWVSLVHKRWLDYGLLAAPDLASLSYASRADYAAGARWQLHRWRPLDPLKTVEAQTARINARLTSPQRVIAEGGEDPDEILAEITEWLDKTKHLPVPALATTNGSNQAPADPAAARRLQLIASRGSD